MFEELIWNVRILPPTLLTRSLDDSAGEAGNETHDVTSVDMDATLRR